MTNRKAKVLSLQVFILDFFIKHNLFLFKTGPGRASGLFQIIDLVLQLQTVFKLVQTRFDENYVNANFKGSEKITNFTEFQVFILVFDQ